MPKPTSPWATRQALDSDVYVLPAKYATQTDDNSVVFHARVGDSFRSVQADEVRAFLEEHRDRTLVAYDALAFHTDCLQAVGGDSQTLWNFLRTYRLWDLALIELRIRYAHAGYADPIQGREGLETIFRERSESQSVPAEVQDILSALGPILRKQINGALKNLPLFHTYRVDGEIPNPVTIDEYCNRLDAVRFQRYGHMSHLPGQDIERIDSGLHRSSLFRRRDLILTGRTGPFGVGLDVQAAIVAEHIDDLSTKGIRPELTQESISYADTIFSRSSQELSSKSTLRSCFQWAKNVDGWNCVAGKSDGSLDVVVKSWRKYLHAVWSKRPSFVSAPHTYPQIQGGEVSAHPADWLDYRFLDSSITAWLKLECAANLRRMYAGKSLFSYSAFPVLRSLASEMLLEHEGEPILQAAMGRTFIVLRWEKLLESSLVSSVFAAYLLHRRYETDEPYTQRFEPVFSPRRSLHSGGPEDGDQNVPQTDFSDYIRPLFNLRHDESLESDEVYRLTDELKALPPAVFRQLIAETLDSFRLLEDADVYRRRLERMGLEQYRYNIDHVYWTIITCIFRPFSTAYPYPFSGIPASGTGRQEQNDANLEEESEDEIDYTNGSLFFRSANIEELMFMSTIHFFGSKADGSPDFTGSFFGILPDNSSGWGFINRLHETRYEFFYTQDEAYTEIRQAAERKGHDKIADELPWTNTVSSTGRLGSPIRYYEWIDADTRQLAADLKTAAAFELAAKGFDVVLVAGNQIVLHVPDQQTDLAVQVATSTVQDAVTAILKSAFPTENPPVDVFDYFVRNKVNSTVTSVWPIPAEPEADAGQEDEVDVTYDRRKEPESNCPDCDSDYRRGCSSG